MEFLLQVGPTLLASAPELLGMAAIAAVAVFRWEEDPPRSGFILAAMGIWILLRLGAVGMMALQSSRTMDPALMSSLYMYWAALRSGAYCIGLGLLGVALFRRKEPDLT